MLTKALATYNTTTTTTFHSKRTPKKGTRGGTFGQPSISAKLKSQTRQTNSYRQVHGGYCVAKFRTQWRLSHYRPYFHPVAG